MIFKKILKQSFSTSRWIKRHLDDPFVKRSQKQNYRSRAVYKLQQIDQKFKIFKGVTKVLDLGSAPGSWSQYIKRTYPQTTVVALDLLPMDSIQGVTFYKGDVQDTKLIDMILKKYKNFGVLMSDIAPQMSGHSDHEQQIQLNKMCISASGKVLQPNGNLVMKTFIGKFQRQLLYTLQILFQQVHRFKPKASRSQSSQQFMVCLKMKSNAPKLIQKLVDLNFTGSLTKPQIQKLLQ